MPTDRRTRKRTRAAADQARRAERQAQLDAEAAARAEQLAEEQAPRQQRVGVRAADGSVLRAPLAEPDAKRGGYRRADVLRRMHAQSPRLVTPRHLDAAERYGRDYERGVLGSTPPRDTLTRVDGSTRPDVPQHRLDALTAYRGACDAMGPSLRGPVQWAALHGWSLGRIAGMLEIAEKTASGYLVAGLDRLADHYWPARARRVPDAPEVVDSEVTDLPQERLGRAPKAAA